MQVSEINNLTFYGLQNLLHLDLSFNNLKTLHDHIFSTLVKLESLLISNNHISEISHLSFHGLQSLQILKLNSNKISDLSTNLLISISNLTELDLSNNNLIYTSFETFKKLSHLSLNGNCDLNLSTLESLSVMRSLMYLDLSDLNLHNIPNQINVFPNLEILKLNENNFTLIPENIFRNLKRLRHLEISENPRLLKVDKNAFSEIYSIEYLIISDNPKLVTLEKNTFKHLYSLERLNLSNNGLKNLNIQEKDNICYIFKLLMKNKRLWKYQMWIPKKISWIWFLK